MNPMLESVTFRFVLGAAAAGAVALAAHRARSLSAGGAAAATIVGSLAVAAGWVWGGLLIAFFLATAALGRVREVERARRTSGVVAKGGARDAIQVGANGGVLALAAVGQLLWPHPAWSALGAGALATAAADSWATELGTLSRRPPRHILTLRPVPAGTSGGVSPLGSAASLAGSAFMAGVAWLLGWATDVALAAAVAGVAGSLADSLLGATIQSRRWCDCCGMPTERIVHSCGHETREAGGVTWMDNDWVNLIATATGGLVAVCLLLAVRHGG